MKLFNKLTGVQELQKDIEHIADKHLKKLANIHKNKAFIPLFNGLSPPTFDHVFYFTNRVVGKLKEDCNK